ncbi:MAG: hypothetical protein AAB473_01980 [Patescibacteria group bacterium]
MTNVLQTGKRALSVAVAAATMLFSVGAGLLQPSVAAAASAGDLIKGTSLSTVYYYGYDGMRYTFPNEKTYMTWYSDFSGVSTISDSALADLSLAGNVVYRPGSYWIKVQSDDKVYAVSTDGSIHWIESETVASNYAGSSWASRVQDVPDVFFTDYTVGSSLMTATAFDGMLYMDGGSYYLSWNGAKRMVSSAGRSANGLQAGFFLSGTGIDDSDLVAGDDITSEVSSVVDAAQTVSSDVTATGSVSVSLASSTAASTSIPDAASGVNVATFKMTAGSSAASVDVMKVSLMGLSATSHFTSSGVYLYEGNVRLTDGKSFNSSTRQATFGSLGLEFAAGETRYISVLVDMLDGSTTSTFSVGIEGSSDVEAGGSVSGSFPISGNTMSIVDSAVGGVTIIDTGSLSNPVIGEQNATISKFKLTASSVEDVTLEHITLKIDDESDHSDFQLYQGTTWLAEGSSIDNKLVMFDLGSNAFSIEKGSDRTFTVTADIGGNAADTITTHLDNAADLYVTGDDFGFGVSVTDADFDTAAEGSTVTIQGGDLTASFSGPSASDVSNTTQNFSLFEGTLVAERAMTITAMPMILTMVETSGGNDSTLEHDPISDIRIVNADTGALLMGPIDLSETADGDLSADLAFTDDFDMDAGETLNFKVTADMESTADATDTFTITMDLTSGLAAEDMDGDAITSVIPTASLAGNAQTVVASGLTVSLASTPTGTKTYVRGTSDVVFASFNFAAANGGAIEVTDFSPSIYVDHNAGGTFAAGQESTTLSTERITSCSLYDGSTLVSGPESIASATTGKVNFNDFSYSVSAGTTETLSVLCNLANIDPSTADYFAATVVATSDVTALDSEGDSATVTGSSINTTPTVIINVTNSGSLAVTAASDTPSADFVLSGSSSNTVSKFRFDATSEAFVVDRLTIEEQQAAADTGSANSTAYSNNVSLVTVSYPDSTGATQTATGALTNNGLTLNGLTFYVAKDSHAEVTVKIDVPSTDRSGGSATSNERIRMVLDDGTGELRAVGQGSGQTLADSAVTTVDTAGTTMNKFVVRETKPTIALNSVSPSGSNKTPGNQETLRFNVTAASGEDVILKNVVFSFSASDNGGPTLWDNCDTDVTDGSEILASGADFHIYNMNKEGTATALDAANDFTILKSTGAVCDGTDADVAFIKLSLTTAEVIPAGSTYAYALYFNSDSASSVNNDSVQIGLASDPITASYIEVANATNETAIAIADTTIDVDTGATYNVGDVIAYDETDGDGGAAPSSSERILVTGISSNTLTVVRGYLGTTPVAYASLSNTADDMYRLPGAMLWQDDGSTAITTSNQEYYGAHLVDSLPITGNSISF